MTETTPTPTEAQETAQQAAQAPQEAQEQPQEAQGNREAAKYRVRAREAEQQVQALQEQLDGMRRAEAERLAGEHLEKPAALWATGTELSDLLDDEGNLDEDKITDAAQNAREQFGAAEPRTAPKPDPTQGPRGEAFPEKEDFSTAFAPRN